MKCKNLIWTLLINKIIDHKERINKNMFNSLNFKLTKESHISKNFQINQIF